ncbi:efflux RND transporter periplasmic adaptor subunit [Halocola ammonii]
MNKKKLIIILAAVVVVLLILALIFGRGEDSISVTVEKAQNRDITETVSASGKVQPEVEVKIISQVSGQVIELPVKEGSEVDKGDLLAKVDPELYVAALNRAEASLNTARSSLSSAKARLSQAQAQLEVAELNYERNQQLFEQGAISKAEFDNATSNYKVAQSEVEAAQESVRSAEFSIASAQATRNEQAENLRRTTIYAPRKGTVTALAIEEGDIILGTGMMQGTEIMRVSDLTTMEVNVEVNETDIVRVGLDDTARVEVDAYLDHEFVGIVTEIANTAMNATGTMTLDQVTNFSVKIRILESSYQELRKVNASENFTPLRPGMSATVEIETATAKDVLSIPIKAVTTRTDTASMSFRDRISEDTENDKSNGENEPLTVVFVKNGELADLEVITTGIQDNEFIQIQSGIDEGDEVITGPYDAVSRKLENGSKIETKREKSNF